MRIVKKASLYLSAIALFTVLFATTVVYAQQTMKIVYFHNYPPYSWMEDNQMKGILIDVMKEAVQTRMGIPVSQKGYPWERAQNMVRDNDADAFVTVPYPFRRAYTEVSKEPVIIAKFTMFVKMNNPVIQKLKAVKSIDDLKDFSIGEYLGLGWAKENLRKFHVDWASTIDLTLKKLVNGRFDLFIGNSPIVNFNIKKLGYLEKIVELQNFLDSQPFHLCIGKKSSFVRILPKFDEIILNMAEDGSLQKIYDKYSK